MGKRTLVVLASLVIFSGLFLRNADAAQKWLIHGPQVFTRTTGSTDVFQVAVRFPAYVTPEFSILIQNGAVGQDNTAATTGSVWLNGAQHVAENEFQKHVEWISKEGIVIQDGVTASGTVNLEVRIGGQPGTNITVWLFGKVDLGDMAAARFGHRSALLADGKVLLTGGRCLGTVLSSAEVYDPATRRFSLPGSTMNSPRHDHSSAALPHGEVLQAGGKDGVGGLSTAELFRPGTQTFSTIGQALTINRAGHSATLLSNGTVLIAGGTDAANIALSSGESFGGSAAEIFDPATGAFTVLPATLPTARGYHTATLLSDGRVLIAGGEGGAGVLGSAEIFDPATGTFSSLPQQMTVARSRHAAALLPDGRVLLLGGTNSTGVLTSAEVFDPLTNAFSTIPQVLSEQRSGHTATLLANGMVLITGGYKVPGSDNATPTAEFFALTIVDNVSPSVASVLPANGATRVERGSFVAVRFSEPVDVTTVADNTFRLNDSGGNAVAGAVVPGEGGLLAFFLPASPLAFGETYTVSLSGEIRDTSGNALSPFTSIFRVSAPPVITDFVPTAARKGTAVTINGQYFSMTPSGNVVSFNGTAAAVSGSTGTTLTVTVPQGATSGPIAVTTADGSATSTQDFTVLPDSAVIKSITPYGASPGDNVTITGDYFNEVIAENQVSFSGPNATTLLTTPLAGTTQSLLVTIPDNAVTGPVRVITRGTTSSPYTYVISPLRSFSLGLIPGSSQAGQGGRAAYLVTVTPDGNFAEVVTLSATGLPAGAAATFDPPKAAPGQRSTLTVTLPASAPLGTNSFTVTGTASLGDRVLSRSVTAALEVVSGSGTSFAGVVLDTQENPVRGVTVTLGGIRSAVTDEAGRFLIRDAPVGDQILIVDGTTAGPSYAVIPFTVNVVPNAANLLNQTVFLHTVNRDHFTPIIYPNEVVATDPRIPDFALKIPAGVSIKDWQGNQVDKVSVTQVPIDRLPVTKLPEGVTPRVVYMFSFDRWGGAIPSRPIPVILPNDIEAAPGEVVNLWYYDESPNLGESPNDWRMFGTGTVSPDGLRIISDPGVGIPKFCCGALFVTSPRVGDPRPSPDPSGEEGEPVDTATGIFTYQKTDLEFLGTTPLVLKRYYSSGDRIIGTFGRGFNSNFDVGILRRDTGERTNDPSVIYFFSAKGTRYRLVRQSDGTFVAPGDPALAQVRLSPVAGGSEMRFPDGSVLSFRSAGNMDWLVEEKDINGNFVRIDRDGAGRPLSVVNSYGSSLTFSGYQGNRGVGSVTDHTGRTVTYSYDSSGQLVTAADPAGRVTRYAYDNTGRMQTITDARGITYLVNEYDANGRVTRQTQPDTSTFGFEYLLSGATVTSAKTTNTVGGTKSSRFSSRGYKLAEFDPFGQRTSIERDYVNNRIMAVTDPLYRVTRFTYDPLGSISSVLEPLDKIELIEYDPVFHKPSKVTDSLNRSTNFAYDAKGNVATRTDPAGNTTRFSYTDKGQLETATDAMDNVTRYFYDERGNLTTVLDPLGNRTLAEYDALNRPVALTDGNGKTSRIVYDSVNQIVSATDPEGNTSHFAYDNNYNLLSVTDSKGQTYTFEYDSLGRVSAMTDWLGNRETRTYDIGGSSTTRTDAKGQATIFRYDTANRLIRIAYADGSTVEYGYDAVGRVSTIRDSLTGTISYTYDQLDRVIQETTPRGSVEYEYDILGRRTVMTTTGQERVTYDYDPTNGVLSSVTQGSTTISLSHDRLGRRTGITYPNNVVTTYSWDAAGKLTNVGHTAVASTVENIGFLYDGTGNITRKSRAAGGELLPPAVVNEVNAGNQIISSTSADNATYTYDPNGNLASSTSGTGTTTYTWDARDRLVAISGPGITANFKYDALNRRIEKTVNGKTTAYLYDGINIIQEQEGGAVKATYLRTRNIDEVLARIASDGIRFYHHDHLGSTVALTDENGITTTVYSYDPFGKTTMSGEASDQPFQYTGRENDGTGLFYYRARYHSPEMARFISKDPILFKGGQLNLYGYVGNNPVRFIDPLGLVWGGGGIEFGFYGSPGGKGFAGGGGWEVSADWVNDDQGNCAIMITNCVGIGAMSGFDKPKESPFEWAKIGGGIGPVMGEGTLKEGCSVSSGGSGTIPVKGAGIGIDITRDDKTGEIMGDFRVGVGAGFGGTGIKCTTRTYMLPCPGSLVDPSLPAP